MVGLIPSRPSPAAPGGRWRFDSYTTKCIPTRRPKSIYFGSMDRLHSGRQIVLPRLFRLVQQRRLPFGTELHDTDDGPFRPDPSRPQTPTANARLHSPAISGPLRERPREYRRAAGQRVDQPTCSGAGGSLDSGRRCLNLVGIFRSGKQNTNHLSDQASLPRCNAKVGDLLSFLEEGLQ